MYDKLEVREQLTVENIFQLLDDFGGEPEYMGDHILCRTICHNNFGEGSRKLYYYFNTGLFQCYSNCGSFDPFELVIKVFKIQEDIDLDLNEAVRYIAQKFGITTEYIPEDESYKKEDWKILNRDYYTNKEQQTVDLKIFDNNILNNLNYNVRNTPWINEGISEESLIHAKIGYFPPTSQITIPHFDKDGKFIGLRGRTLVKEDAEKYGKYRPMRIGKVQYNHPLGFNLYNLNNSKDNIKAFQKAIIFESEKSTLLYQSYFGIENDISVACCGSNISNYQIQLLLDDGAKEIIVALDRQFQEIGDDEWKHLTDNLKKINERYKNYVNISFIFDKNMITSYKASPIDEGRDKFLQLFSERKNL